MISIVACYQDAKLSAHAARISGCNKMELWPGCGGCTEFSLHTKNGRSVWFVVKRRGCCCNLSSGVALIVWFTTNGMCVKNNTIICVARASNSKRDCNAWSLLLLAARMWSFAHMPFWFPIATVDMIPGSFVLKTWNIVIAAGPSSCLALIVGCKGKFYVHYWHWLWWFHQCRKYMPSSCCRGNRVWYSQTTHDIPKSRKQTHFLFNICAKLKIFSLS